MQRSLQVKENLQLFLISNSLLELVVGDHLNSMNFRSYPFHPALPCQSKVFHLGWSMVFSATFNNISIISWRSVLFGGGNRCTRIKPPTSRKLLATIIT